MLPESLFSVLITETSQVGVSSPFCSLLLLSPCLFLASLLILQCSAPNAFSTKSDQTAPRVLLLPSLFIPSAGSPGQETEAPGEKGDHKNQLKK